MQNIFSERRDQMTRIWSTLLLTAMLSGSLAPTAWSQSDSGLIEPGAGTWQTWVLTSGSDLRLPAPPDMSQTMGEMEALREIVAQRDSAAMDRVHFTGRGQL